MVCAAAESVLMHDTVRDELAKLAGKDAVILSWHSDVIEGTAVEPELEQVYFPALSKEELEGIRTAAMEIVDLLEAKKEE